MKNQKNRFNLTWTSTCSCPSSGRVKGERPSYILCYPFLCILIIICASVLSSPSTAASANIPDTGQTHCYNNMAEISCPAPGENFYGQDSNYTINPMSYTKLDAAGNDLPDAASSWTTVRDNITGLIWEVKLNKDDVMNYSDPHDADNMYTWYDSDDETCGGDHGTPGTEGRNTEALIIVGLNSNNYGGYDDWRMPTIKELASIANYSIPDPGPTINAAYFPNTKADGYASSDTNAQNTSKEWGMSFGNGESFTCFKSSFVYVRAVRGEQSGDNFVIHGDGTVTDTETGLMWQQYVPDIGRTWEQALSFCETLRLPGYTDWRLPTIKELQTLAKYTSYNPAINTTAFPGTPTGNNYWSSTTYTGNINSARSMYFYNGMFGGGSDKNTPRLVRAVRGGQSESSNAPRIIIDWNGDLVADFDDAHGLNSYHAATGWTQLNGLSNVNRMLEWNDGSNVNLVVDFGAARGLSYYDGTWHTLTAWDDVNKMAVFNNKLAVDFGNGRGIYTYNGAWTKITSWDTANKMVAWDGKLVVDFGSGNGTYSLRGTYLYNGTAWNKMTSWCDVKHMAVYNNGENDILAVDFGGNRGIFTYDGAWTKITGWDTAQNMIACGSNLAVDFGSGRGLLYYNDTWTKITSWDTTYDMTEWNDGTTSNLVVDFGNGSGLKVYNGTSWSPLSGLESTVKMLGFGTDLGVDFGPGRGVSKYNSGSNWTKINDWSTAD